MTAVGHASLVDELRTRSKRFDSSAKLIAVCDQALALSQKTGRFDYAQSIRARSEANDVKQYLRKEHPAIFESRSVEEEAFRDPDPIVGRLTPSSLQHLGGGTLQIGQVSGIIRRLDQHEWGTLLENPFDRRDLMDLHRSIIKELAEQLLDAPHTEADFIKVYVLAMKLDAGSELIECAKDLLAFKIAYDHTGRMYDRTNSIITLLSLTDPSADLLRKLLKESAEIQAYLDRANYDTLSIKLSQYAMGVELLHEAYATFMSTGLPWDSIGVDEDQLRRALEQLRATNVQLLEDGTIRSWAVASRDLLKVIAADDAPLYQSIFDLVSSHPDLANTPAFGRFMRNEKFVRSAKISLFRQH